MLHSNLWLCSFHFSTFPALKVERSRTGQLLVVSFFPFPSPIEAISPGSHCEEKSPKSRDPDCKLSEEGTVSVQCVRTEVWESVGVLAPVPARLETQ